MEVMNQPKPAASCAMTSTNLHKTEVTQSSASHIQTTFMSTTWRDVITKREIKMNF